MASEGMQSVLTLVNRLQAAATTLGDVAGGDKSLPSLWDMLPSIVVIGGSVTMGHACRVPNERCRWSRHVED